MSDIEVIEEIQSLGCGHYKRKCALQCSECKEFHICRFCHDDIHEHNIKDLKKSHKIDRHNIEAVKCLECEHVQKPDQTCENCGIEFAKYFCPKCNLYDEEGEEKELYHCDDCKICRQGGGDNSYHCQGCDICLPISMRDEHQCTNFRNVQCPICFEDFFSIRDSGCRLKCGHLLHSECFDEYFKTSFSCPICKKFPFDNETKLKIYAGIDEQIDNTLMSEELQNLTVDILCNDCNKYSLTNFNVVALKCPECLGYNTAQVRSQDSNEAPS
ncbi:unnamed protein product [Moneuplotes crassus]|uniref:Uncharacterized protein n=1 Tax=Euplotes crassus TaxID=5936 RepID=A0AAD1XTK2_EUPCR|nr:unnamed protein product [Moneuplotes crassus]